MSSHHIQWITLHSLVLAPTQRHTAFEICEPHGFTPAHIWEFPSVPGLGRLTFVPKDVLHIISSSYFIGHSQLFGMHKIVGMLSPPFEKTP